MSMAMRRIYDAEKRNSFKRRDVRVFFFHLLVLLFIDRWKCSMNDTINRFGALPHAGTMVLQALLTFHVFLEGDARLNAFD